MIYKHLCFIPVYVYTFIHCNETRYLLWWEGTPFEAMTGCTAPSSDGLLAEVFWGFLGFSSAVRQIPGDLCTAPRVISLSPLSLATDVTDATLGASGLLARNPDRGWWHRHTSLKLFWLQPPWLHGQQGAN